MDRARSLAVGAVLAVLAGSLVGCSTIMHELQPHRLRRWNQGPGMESGAEAYYSIRDEIPERDASDVSADAFQPPIVVE